MKPRIFHFLLALCLALSCFPTLTPFPAAADETYGLWLGGVQVTSSNAANLAEAVRQAGGDVDGAASYDAASHTLALDGFRYAGPGYSVNLRASNGYTYTFIAALYSEGPLDIVFSGANDIRQNSVDAEAFLHGIFCRDDLRLIGTGDNPQLNAEAGKPKSGRGANIYHSIGIHVVDETTGERQALSISGNGVVTAQGGDDGNSSGYRSRSLGACAETVSVGGNCVFQAMSGYTTGDTCIGLSTLAVTLSENGAFSAMGGYDDANGTALEGTLELTANCSGSVSYRRDGADADELSPGQSYKFSRQDSPAYHFVMASSSDSGNGGSSGGGSGSGGGDPAPSPSEDCGLFAVNVSGAGADAGLISNMNASGWHDSQQNFPDAFQEALNPEDAQPKWFAFRYMSAASSLLEGDDPTPLYFRDTGTPTAHELILYGRERLDPEKFTITTGAKQLEPFDGGHFGDGDGSLYYYRTVIEVPAEANYIVIMYQQRRAAFLDAVRISGFDNVNSIWPTQIYPRGFETDADGVITSFTLDVAGLNLPAARDAYSMEGCSLTNFSGPDSVGKYSLTFRNDSREELVWKDLLINGQPRKFFQSSCLDSENPRLVTDYDYGVPCQIPTPYYSLDRFGTLEEDTAPYVLIGQSGEFRDAGIVRYRNLATTFCAFYDADGRMTNALEAQAGDCLAFAANGPAVKAKIIALGDNFAPQSEAVEIPLA